MKILLLGSKEYPFGSSYIYDRKAGGGIEIHVEKLAKFLAREGHEVFIITRQFPGQKKEETIGERIHIYRTRFLYNTLLRAMTFNLFAAWKALRIIRKKNVDLIHCHGPIAGVFGAKLSKLTGRPMIFTPHGTVSTWSSPIREILMFFEDISVLFAKKTIFISKRAQEEMTAVMRFPNILLTNAIDMEDYPQINRKEHRATKFLFLGRLEKIKGIREIMQAFAMLSKKLPDVRLTIAGDGAMRNEVEEFARNHSNVKFLGWSTEVPKLLSEHDVFLLPSQERGQPVALLEAMISGALIVTSLDYISDMETGIRVRPGDVKELYEKMLYVYENPELSMRLAENAKNTAKELSWGVVIKSFLREYKQMID